MTKDQLDSELAGFIGTTQYFRASPLYSLALTDGSKFLLDKVGGYWLADIVGTECWQKMREYHESLLFVRLTVADGKMRIDLLRDTGPDDLVWTRDIAYTDWPEGEWMLYLALADVNMPVLFLPSEY